MMIGPAPTIRTEWISVRFGIGREMKCETGEFESAKCGGRHEFRGFHEFRGQKADGFTLTSCGVTSSRLRTRDFIMFGIHDYWLFIVSGLLLNMTPGQDTL